MTRWIVKLIPSPQGGAVFVIPNEVMQLAGWSINDDVEVSVTPSGSIVLVRPIVKTHSAGGDQPARH